MSLRSRLPLVACSVAYALVILGTTVVNVALPSIRADLGGSTSGLQWVANGYLLMLASLLLTAGTLCDLLGARRTMLAGLTLFVTGGTIAASAQGLAFLVVGQVFLGAGASALIPASLAIIRHSYEDERERTHAIGIWASTSALAIAAGPVVGGLLITLLGWRAAFAIDIPIAATLATLVVRHLDDGPPPRWSRNLDLPGQVLGIGALGLLTYALVEGGPRGWTSPAVVAAFAAAAGAWSAFVFRERQTPEPMLPRGLFRSRSFSAGSGVGMLFTFSLYGLLFVLSLYLQERQGLSALETGLVFLANPVAYAITALLVGRLATRIGSRLPVTLGSLLAAAATFLLAIESATSVLVVVAGLIVLGIGAAGVIPLVTADVISEMPPAQVGIAAATFNAMRNTGAVLGVAVAGATLGRSLSEPGLRRALETCGAGLLAAALISIARRASRHAIEEPICERPVTVET